MAQIRQTLKLESDPTTEVYPNIKPECIPALAIDEAKIASNAVTENKIADAAVTNSKLANNAVTEAKIDDGAVTNTKLATNSVTSTKIANNAVTRPKIQRTDNYVMDDDLGDTIYELCDHFINLYKEGFKLYFYDGVAEFCSVDSINVDQHGTITLYCQQPIQGLQQITTIDSTNFQTFFSSGMGEFLHYCGA